MGNQVKRNTTIAISQQTKDALDSIKHPGQSYEGVIQALVEFWVDTLPTPSPLKGGPPG